MKKLAILYFILTILPGLQAQPFMSNPAGNLAFTGTIKGKVIETTGNKPVEYATVTLYNAKDSVMINGVVTNADGYFEFKKLDAGVYNLIVSFMGYRKVFISGINISENKQVHDVGTVSLRSNVTNLNEVEIVGNAPKVEYKIDRKVVNVDQQLQAQGGTAVDVLERIPSIKTDLEGNVALRGSTAFTVLIDGKPSILTGSDALNQIPASTIDKIEIITNPSAKYDPDGSAGIINIITKKNMLKGLSGIINLSAGTSPDYSGSILLNYRTKKSSISLGVDMGNREMTGYRNSYRESYLGDTISYLQTNNKNTNTRKSISLKAGMDFSISDKNTITGEVSYRLFNMSRIGDTKNTNWGSLDVNHQYYLTNILDESEHPTLQFTMRDVQKFKKEGSELTAQLIYNQGDDSGEEKTQQYSTDQTWQEAGAMLFDYKTNTTEGEKEWRGDLDFEHPFTEKSKLEAGFQLRMESNDEDYRYYNYDSATGDWIKDTVQSNRYDFYNNIYALYGTYSTEIKSLSLKAGLRLEYTDRNLKQITGKQDYPFTKFDYYPSFYLTYRLPYNQTMQLSYSKRVNRPHGGELNPYVYFSDAFNSYSGNPYLEPEYSHNLELNYMKYFGYTYLAVESYCRITTNKMTRVQTLNDQGVLQSTMQNINGDQSLGVEMSGNIQVNSWFTINPVATVYDYRLRNISDTTSVTRSSTNWSASVELGADLKTATKIRLNANYDGPTVTVDGTRKGVFYMGFSARQDFLKRKLSVTFNIRDVLNTRVMKSTSTGVNYYTSGENWRQAPIFSIAVSYKWNNYNRRRGGPENFDGDYDVINANEF